MVQKLYLEDDITNMWVLPKGTDKLTFDRPSQTSQLKALRNILIIHSTFRRYRITLDIVEELVIVSGNNVVIIVSHDSSLTQKLTEVKWWYR